MLQQTTPMEEETERNASMPEQHVATSGSEMTDTECDSEAEESRPAAGRKNDGVSSNHHRLRQRAMAKHDKYFFCEICLRACRTFHKLKKHCKKSHRVKVQQQDFSDRENGEEESDDDDDDDDDENLQETTPKSESVLDDAASLNEENTVDDTDVIGFGDELDLTGENLEAIEVEMEEARRYAEIGEENYGRMTVYSREVHTIPQLISEAKKLLQEQNNHYMIQIQIGYILKDLATQEYTLYYGASNTCLFTLAMKVKKRRDSAQVIAAIKNYQWEEFFKTPKSGMIPIQLAYARYLIVQDTLPLTSCNCKFTELPDWIKNNRYIWSSNRTNHHKHEFCDNLCVFRAVAEHFFRTKIFSFGRTRSQIQKHLFSKFVSENRMPGLQAQQFDGVLQEEFPKLEEMFNVSINMYIFDWMDSTTPSYPKQLRATPIYFGRETESQNGTCNLVRYGDHVCYISDLERALGRLTCPSCDQQQTIAHFARHFRSCSNRLKQATADGQVHVYHDAQLYCPQLEIFEEIERECNLCFPAEMKFVKYLTVFDSEVYFRIFADLVRRGKSTVSQSQLIPFVVGVCSNVPGFEKAELFWLTELGPDFVECFVEYLVQISNTQKELLENQLRSMFHELEWRLKIAEENENEYGTKLFRSLKEKLAKFIRQMPVLSFNGAKFDCKVLREHLIPALYKRYGDGLQTKMKDGSYSRIVTPEMVFLDQLSYLPAGKSSYDNWIFDSLGVKLKSHMPYSWIQGLDCLDYPGLPDLEHWHSSLKGFNVLSLNFESYQKYLQQGLTSEQALKNLGLQQIPKLGQETLDDLRWLFHQQGMKTFKDFVAYYLKFDVEPFVKAAEKGYSRHFDQYGIQLYRCYASIPGVAAKIGMRYMKDDEIYIPCTENYKLFREKTPGGQSILVTLEALAGITKIREREFGQDALTCKSIFSLDASMMYGYCMQTLPCNHEIVRKPENRFIPEYTSKKYSHYWNAERILSFLIWNTGLKNPSTYLRGGESKCRMTAKSYQPDCVAEVWENGKFHHLVVIEIYGDAGHCCPIHSYPETDLHPVRKDRKGQPMTFADVQKADAKRIEQVKWEYSVKEVQIIHMCEFKRDYEDCNGPNQPLYQQFLDSHPQYDLQKQAMTEPELLQQIYKGNLHGFLLADFDAGPELRNRTEQFPLFFKKTEVGREDVGPLMQQYLENMNLLRKPACELISSHFGKQLLIATNLVQFYMEMGAEVSNVQRFIQYDLTGSLGNMVADAADLRYKGTVNKDDKVLGDNMKSLVNSCYGKFLLNPKHFTQIKYVKTNGLLKQLYNKSFISCEYVGQLEHGDELYELKKKPKRLHHQSPVQLGCWILNSAKLHILSLIYKVIEPCVDPRSWTIFCSQTDSVSIVCAEKDMEMWLEKWVIPGTEQYLQEMKKKYLVAPGTDEEAKKSAFRPGVYKLEWKGEAALGISAKVYAVFDSTRNTVKLSARSVPHVAAKNITFYQFYDVLHRHNPITVEYEGFNYVCGSVLSEKMQKTAITPMYIKREVLSDLTTKTLNL